MIKEKIAFAFAFAQCKWSLNVLMFFRHIASEMVTQVKHTFVMKTDQQPIVILLDYKWPCKTPLWKQGTTILRD